MQQEKKQCKPKRWGRKIAEAIDAFVDDVETIFISVKKAELLIVKVIIWILLVGSTAAHWLPKIPAWLALAG
jgi:hypothetical protein